MVMKRNVMRKNLLQTIRSSIGRYIAIVAIIALGSGMFVGLLTTKTDMIATTQSYTKEQNMFHLRLLNTYGWTETELEKIAQLPNVEDAEGGISLDVIARFETDGDDKVYRLHTIPEKVNKVYLLGGRMPQNETECLADGSHADDTILGTKVFLSDENAEDTMDALSVKTFTIVGYVSTPLYMDATRGSTTVGNGTLTSYIYVPYEAISADYYSEINVTLGQEYEAYTDALTQLMEETTEDLKPQLTQLVQQRYEMLKSDAQAEYDDGYQQYEQGLADYEKGKAELADALKKLEDGQTEYDENVIKLQEGEEQLAEAQITLQNSRSELEDAQKKLSASRKDAKKKIEAARAELTSAYETAMDGQEKIEAGLNQLDDGISQLQLGLTQLNAGIEQLNITIAELEQGIETTAILLEAAQSSVNVDQTQIEQLNTELVKLQTTLNECLAQKEQQQTMQKEYTSQLDELAVQKENLLREKATVEAGIVQIETGLEELTAQEKQVNRELASAQAQIDDGFAQLEKGQKELEEQAAQLEEGKAELESAKISLEEGWAEYNEQKEEAEQKLSDAKLELDDAKAELDEAKQAISDMKEPELFVLDRNTNAGYLAVDSNSDIVEGVSKVFPAFFLLIAALVCITTLTKMVDEERTQIGILKAMGYGNSAIIRKYLLYCGSAAVIGCSLGVSIGSVIFPKILWFAYGIILCVRPELVLKLNIPLCLAVIGVYTLVSMTVTWFCCRRELRAVPAQLIRPKAPAAGKKIILEYLPFWNKISFLNKVMFRNVFRYRQRFLMTMVGIGGCTALLLTGFGIRDSIGNIVNYQFEDVMIYDMEVYFAESQSSEQQEDFREKMAPYAEQMMFYHRTSVELEYDHRIKDVSMLVMDDDLQPFLNLHNGEMPIEQPSLGEIVLTVGTAENLGLTAGDEVILRNADMQTLRVKVSGIFDNHVNNYLIISPETIEQQWGEVPDEQMVMLNVRDGQDIHAAGAEIGAMESVLSVSISQDIADQVGGMLEALDLVVITVVICAGLLAMIVLYNLTNISISERIREIATIKVLGFQPKEAAAYVFKENLLLSAIGAGVGLVGGIFLLKFVMSQIKIDMVWFQDRLTLPSYLLSWLLTMLSACLVDFILYFKLEKINMAEALKSVE